MIRAVKNLLKLSLFSFLFLQSACGTGEVRDFGEFDRYVNQFEMEAKKHNWPLRILALKIKFGTLPPQTLALCTVGQDTPLITINENRWTTLSEVEKTIVLTHELGHCVLNRKHDNAEDPKRLRRTKSLMHSHPLVASDYKVHEDDYLAELFSQNSDIQ